MLAIRQNYSQNLIQRNCLPFSSGKQKASIPEGVEKYCQTTGAKPLTETTVYNKYYERPETAYVTLKGDFEKNIPESYGQLNLFNENGRLIGTNTIKTAVKDDPMYRGSRIYGKKVVEGEFIKNGAEGTYGAVAPALHKAKFVLAEELGLDGNVVIHSCSDDPTYNVHRKSGFEPISEDNPYCLILSEEKKKELRKD